MKRNLVVCCVGPESLHPGWVGGDREFDVFLINYGPDRADYRAHADWYELSAGSKMQLLARHLSERWDRVSAYRAVWLPDDDIATTTADVNAMFAAFEEYEFALAQPALTSDSYISWPITRQRRWARARLTNFVEVMVPVMTTTVLEQVLPTFSVNPTGWGVDDLWTKIVRERAMGRIGVLDATAVRHTRPVQTGGGYYAAMGLDPFAERAEVLAANDIEPRRTQSGAIIGSGGRSVTIRWPEHGFQFRPWLRRAIRSVPGGAAVLEARSRTRAGRAERSR